MEEVDKEISEMKLSLNARARVVAESYLLAVSKVTYTCRNKMIKSFFSLIREVAISPDIYHVGEVERIKCILPDISTRQLLAHFSRDTHQCMI